MDETAPTRPTPAENSAILAEMWPRFVGWQRRWGGPTGRFLLETLSQHQARRVFDTTLGDGCDSIHLLEHGFDVTSNEIDSEWKRAAESNAKRAGVVLSVRTSRWETDDFVSEAGRGFDAVLCLGNSLTYLKEDANRLAALRHFRELLRPGGILILDERNYQYILDRRDDINAQKMHADLTLTNPFPFRYSHEYVYCGTEVRAFPYRVRDNCVQFRYVDDAGRRISPT
mgnify:CR=1 FL=1